MAIAFDTSEYAGLTTSVPTLASAFTVTAWVKGGAGFSDNRAVFYLGDTSGGSPYAYAGWQSGGFITRLANIDWGANSGSDVGASSWHFWAWVRESSQTKLYLDGGSTADATLNNQGGTPSSNNGLRIGAGNGTSSGMSIEAVKIWSATLTTTEIAAEMNRYDPVRSTNVYAWWKFLTATDLTDQSGNGHTLTATGTLATDTGPGGISTGGATSLTTVAGSSSLTGVIAGRVVGTLITPTTP